MLRSLAFILISSWSYVHADDSWFNGTWTLDGDRTKAAWTESQIQLRGNADEILKISKNLTWRVQDGFFGISRDGLKFHTYSYSIRPVPEGGFEVLLEGWPYSESMIVNRTESGFCAIWTRFGWEEPDYEERLHHIDCFKRSAR